MNETKQSTQNHESAITRTAFWGTIALAAITLLVSGYFFNVMSKESRTLLIYLAMAVFVSGMAAMVASIIFTLRGRQDLGVRLAFYMLFVLGTAAVALFQGRAFTAIPSILVISIMVVKWLFPSGLRRKYALMIPAGIILMGAIEWINPPWRIQVAAASAGPIGAIIFALVLGGLAFSQFRNYSLRTKLISAFLAVTLIPMGMLSFISVNTARQNLTEGANSSLTSAAAATSAALDEFISNGLNDLRTAAQLHILQEYLALPASQRAGSETELSLYKDLRSLARRDQTFITSVGLLDKTGVDVADTDLMELGKDKSDRNYFTGPRDTKLPYVSPAEISESTGILSLYFSAPVRDDAGKIIGVLRVRYDAAVLQKIVKDAIENSGLQDASADLFDENHIVLAVTDHPHEFLKTVVPLPADKLAQLQAEHRLPEGSVESLSFNEPELEQALNNASQQPIFTFEEENEQVAFATLQTQPWVLLSAQNRDVFLTPVGAQTRTSLIIASVVALAVAGFGLFLSQTLAGPIVRLTAVAKQIAEGDNNAQANVESQDEIGVLAGAFNTMTAQLRDFIATLEQRVADRTRNLELAAEVGRSVSQVRALDVMLKDAAELIRSQFDLYYVQVYLTDASHTNLLLLSGTGRVGEQLVGRGHRLPLNTSSINGRAAIEKKAVVIAHTAASATFRPNPLLPDTRSEMAIPLVVGEKVVGVLDLQSEIANALGRELLPAFEALAGQLAIAIQNANLLAEAEQARAEVEAQARRLVRVNWADYLDAIHKPEETGFVFEQNKVMPLAQAAHAQTLTTENGNSLTVPIEVTGEAVGNLVVELDDQSSVARSDELINTVAQQVAQRVEALRLLDSAERYRAEAEEASRRLTREGWKTYVEHAEESLSYFYNLNEVKPHNGNGHDESAVALPLKVRDEVLGKLAIQGLDANDTQSLELVNAVAERLSAHIESLRQFDETKRGQIELDRRAQQLAAVAEISTASSKELDIQTMLESVVNLTQRKFDLYHAHVFTYNEYTDELQIVACGWQEGDEHEGTHETVSIPLSRERSLVARAARTKQVVIVNDVKSEDGFLPNPLLPDTASEMAVPLVIGDQVLGVLDVQSDHINAFTEEDANIETTLAAQVATALQNARSFARAQQQAARESTLNVISQKIQSATSVEAVLQIAARELGHALGAPMTVAQLSMKDKS